MIHNAYDTHGHSPSFIQSQIKKMQLHQLQKYNQKTQKTQTFLPKGQLRLLWERSYVTVKERSRTRDVKENS